jgi:hypothetical protein
MWFSRSSPYDRKVRNGECGLVRELTARIEEADMRTILIALTLVVAAGCSVQDAKQSSDDAAPKATSVAEMGGAVIEETEGEKVSGTVAESHDAAGFTYLLLDHDGTKEWYVVGPIGVKPGEELVLETRMTAENFESKSLKRSFDRVTFARVVSGGTAVPVHPAQEHASMMAAQMPHGHPGSDSDAGAAASPVKEPVIRDITKAGGPEGRTVAEIWSSRAALRDRNVVVRGQVVKSLSGIMGKNWIHLRDGSGSAAAGDHDITITTDGSAKVGDVILVSGTVRVDKEFGAGYEYAVMIEDAKIGR